MAKADWADADKIALRLPYTLGDTKGLIEIRRDGERWTVYPDRCETEKGGQWRPFPKEQRLGARRTLIGPLLSIGTRSKQRAMPTPDDALAGDLDVHILRLVRG